MPKNPTDVMHYCSTCGKRRPATYNAHTRTHLSRCCVAEAFRHQKTLWVVISDDKYFVTLPNRESGRSAKRHVHDKFSDYMTKLIPVQVRW